MKLKKNAVLALLIAFSLFLVSCASQTTPGSFPDWHPFKSAKAKVRYLKAYDAWAAKWPVPSETRNVATSFGQTFVRICGPAVAPPLVLFHGISGNGLQWSPNIPTLSKYFRLYVIDNIYDNGRSVYSKAPKNSVDFIAWLDELFDSLGLKKNINLMGLSYGGWLTSQYGLQRPDRLNKIVLVAPVYTILPINPEWIRRAILTMIPLKRFTRSFSLWHLTDLMKKDPAAAREWMDNAELALACYKPKKMVNPTMLTDDELRSFKIPVLFLVGENEIIYHGTGADAIKRLNTVAPKIKTILIPVAGHDLTIVQAELVNGKVIGFLIP